MSNLNQRLSDSTPSVNDVSRISAGSTIRGEIISPYDIRIDGNFEGKIISDAKVVVGEKATIKGDIICNDCDFSGTIEGNFYVKDTLSLKGTCSVDGDLHTRRFQVELDAQFNGNCRMITPEEFDVLTGSAVAPEAAAYPEADIPPVASSSPFSIGETPAEPTASYDGIPEA